VSSRRNRIVSPSLKFANVPLSVLGDLVKSGARARVGSPTVADLLGLAAPLQSLYAGVTEYCQVPGGVELSEQLVPDTSEAHVPETMVSWEVPAES
jgi:hypothetical protein